MNQLRLDRIEGVSQKATRCEQGVFNWTERLRRIVDKSNPDGDDTPLAVRKIIRRMRTPNQGNFHKLLDQLSDEMVKIHGDVWVKSALNTLGMGDEEDEYDVKFSHMHDALDNWTLNTLVYFRATALTMKHTVPHYDPYLRRLRLANIVRSFRSASSHDQAKKALSIYRKFRYQPVVLASNRAGRGNMFIDPTVSVSYTKHRRVAKPVALGSFTFGDPSKERIREATYVKAFQSFKNKIKGETKDTARRKVNSWLMSRGLKRRPRRFTYSDQVLAWDEMNDAYESGKLGSYGFVSKGKFTRKDLIHPLATFWKRPIGYQEWRAWYKWWKNN